MKIKVVHIVFIVLCVNAFAARAQEPLPLTYQSTLIGVGKMNVYDTYLSPLQYSGTNFGLLYEKIKMTGLAQKRISAQHLVNFEMAKTENPAGTATDYAGYLEYGYGMHYRFEPINRIQFFAGLQADGLLGLVYNARNGNNPVTTKAHLNFNVSGMAAYKFRIKTQTFRLRYQLNIPIAGYMFSPEYGQSYYEIGQGGGENLIYFASPGNHRTMRNILSLELPFSFCTLRLAYMNWVYQTKVNDLTTRIMSNSFYVGFSTDFFTVSGKNNNKNYRHVFE